MKDRMSRLLLSLAVVALLAAAGLAVIFVRPSGAATPPAAAPAVPAAPDVFASPINGGCYIAAPGQCRIHVDPFTINIASGKRLVLFQLQANGTTVYDFRTDVSNPPPSSGTTYTPSLVAQDFAANCGQTYTLNILGKDSGDANSLNMGSTASFTCPSGVP